MYCIRESNFQHHSAADENCFGKSNVSELRIDALFSYAIIACFANEDVLSVKGKFCAEESESLEHQSFNFFFNLIHFFFGNEDNGLKI